ncbi:hypothetical protein C8A03DRAFT_18754 [Achaetomium macrosporum]|uniref:Uncharacterized protein n=1 Tax=Achaetomium macrosporum TaxID=79813 RepID=A0AAN7C2T1_9PEZI|nr:hypothetical protein C8A03DRAFT_18754 [Achaetomium macrosporum]
MAAFDPIEFFGVGHGRYIAIVRHARKQSQGSISLSSVCPPANDALEQSAPDAHWATMIKSGDLNRVPMSPPVHSFVSIITPEDSVFGVTFDLLHAPPPASPTVSRDSSRASPSIEECPLHRYLGSEERYERLALTFCADIRAEDEPSTPNIPKSSSPAGYPLEDKKPGSAGCQSTNSASPLHRYLTDALQAHERLALSLDLQDQAGQQPNTKASDQGEPKTDSSISLTPSDGSGAREKNDSILDMSMEELLAKVYRRERERVLARPRSFNVPRKRVRDSMPPGHRNKTFRRR